MSRLEQLLAKLCPDGVEYRPLGEMANICRGVRVVRKELIESGKYQVFQNSLKPLGYYNEANVKGGTAFVIGAGAAGEVGYSASDFWAADDCYYVDGGDVLIGRYAYYCLTSRQDWLLSKVRKASIPRLSRDFVEALSIPIPPIEIQREVVEILDKFALLTAELTAELAKRKKQYEHYRRSLLGGGAASAAPTNPAWPLVKLGDVCEKICSGGTPTASRKEYYGGNIPWLRTQEVDWCDITDTAVKITEEGLENSSAKWIEPNCVIVAMYGATAAKVAINKIPLTTNQACCNLQVNPKIANHRYVFHWLSNQYEQLKSLGQGSQSNINAKIVRDYPIPLPPLAEQERIVKILDRFDALCNSLSEGLPAEIERRKKQYAYYRDKLLAFPEKGAA